MATTYGLYSYVSDNGLTYSIRLSTLKGTASGLTAFTGVAKPYPTHLWKLRGCHVNGWGGGSIPGFVPCAATNAAFIAGYGTGFGGNVVGARGESRRGQA